MALLRINSRYLLLGGSPIRISNSPPVLDSPATVEITGMGSWFGAAAPVDITVSRTGIDADATGQLLTFVIAGVAPVNVRVANASGGVTVSLPAGRIFPAQSLFVRITSLGTSHAKSLPRASAPFTYDPPDRGFPYAFDFAFEE